MLDSTVDELQAKVANLLSTLSGSPKPSSGYRQAPRCGSRSRDRGRQSSRSRHYRGSAQHRSGSSAEQRQTSFYVTVVRNSPPAEGKSYMKKVKAKVNKDGSAKELIEAAVKEVGDGLEASKCILVEVRNKKAHKFYEDTESVEYIRAEDKLLLCEVADAKAFSMTTEQRWGTSSFSPLSACSGATQSSSSTCGERERSHDRGARSRTSGHSSQRGSSSGLQAPGAVRPSAVRPSAVPPSKAPSAASPSAPSAASPSAASPSLPSAASPSWKARPKPTSAFRKRSDGNDLKGQVEEHPPKRRRRWAAGLWPVGEAEAGKAAPDTKKADEDSEKPKETGSPTAAPPSEKPGAEADEKDEGKVSPEKSGLGAEALAALPPDEPPGTEAFQKVKVVFDRHQNPRACFDACFGYGSSKFLVSQKQACNNLYAACRIARACWRKVQEEGFSQRKATEFRDQCLEELDAAVRLGTDAK